jgi:hypothetical protein
VPTLIVLDDLMDSTYWIKGSELFTKVPHYRNISFILITQNLFHQVSSTCDISLNSKYIVVLKNPRDKMQIVHLARQVYPENISSFYMTYLDDCRDPHTYLFLDLTQSINYLLRIRTKVFLDKITKVFATVESDEPIEIIATFPSRSYRS